MNINEIVNWKSLEAKVEKIKAEGPLSEESLMEILKGVSIEDGLSVDDSARLLFNTQDNDWDKVYRKANLVKQSVFGRTVAIFAPLYLSNYCINNCDYCGFRKDNDKLPRKALNDEEILREVKYLEDKGYRRILLVLGEDPNNYGADYISHSVKLILNNSAITTVHVNAPPMDVEDLKKIRQAGASLYQVFQETYHRPTYEKVHPSGIKKSYDYRIDVMDRIMDAGFDGMGVGVLLGLYDYRYDVLAALTHKDYLKEKYGKTVSSFSIPRLKDAEGNKIGEGEYPLTDDDLRHVVAIYRLGSPQSGVTVSTRETAEFRHELLYRGANNMSAASSTEPGGYTSEAKATLEQFATTDHRDLESVMHTVMEKGLLPALVSIMDFSGKDVKDLKDFYSANAALSIKEFVAKIQQHNKASLFEDEINKVIDELGDSQIKDDFTQKIKETQNSVSYY